MTYHVGIGVYNCAYIHFHKDVHTRNYTYKIVSLQNRTNISVYIIYEIYSLCLHNIRIYTYRLAGCMLLGCTALAVVV